MTTRYWLIIMLCCLGGGIFTPAPAQIQVNGWSLDAPMTLNHPQHQTPTHTEWIVISSESLHPAALRRELQASGWIVAAYLPRGGWLARLRDEPAARQWRDDQSKNANGWRASISMAFAPAPMNIQRELWEVSQQIEGDEMIGLVVHHVGAGRDLTPIVENSGGMVSSVPADSGKRRIGVKVALNRLAECLEAISGHPGVYSIQAGGGARLLNDNASRIVQSGTSTGATTIWNRGLRGEGQVIAILDTGLDFDSCYFAENDATSPPLALGTAQGSPDLSRRKVIMYDLLYAGDWDASPDDFDNQGHGTAVAGNALGSRFDFPFDNTVNNGVAPAARLIVQDAGFTGFDDCADLIALQCPVVDLTPFLDQAVAQGAHIHNNSWGDRENFSPQNTYTAPTADMDDAVWRHPEFLIVCAAGNSGGSGNDTVGSPSVGKNVISAGATQSPTAGGDAENIANFSSRGWASDGRIKPDLTAPGQTISARGDGSILTANCSTQIIQGTSMASPVIAAAAALVRQYYIEGWHPTGSKTPADGFAPTAALIKATLLNGAVNMTGVAGAPPNRTEGWGRTHLENSLFFSGDARRLIAIDARDEFTTTSTEAWTTSFIADGNEAAGDIRVTLVWTDYPASPAASTALVNDLNLTVRYLSDNEEFRGNVLDALTGLSQIGGAADTINNVEMVVLPGSVEGRMEVLIEPSLIVEGPQGFALVISGDVTPANPSPAQDWWIYIR